jgi:hypothetical protein
VTSVESSLMIDTGVLGAGESVPEPSIFGKSDDFLGLFAGDLPLAGVGVLTLARELAGMALVDEDNAAVLGVAGLLARDVAVPPASTAEVGISFVVFVSFCVAPSSFAFFSVLRFLASPPAFVLVLLNFTKIILSEGVVI